MAGAASNRLIQYGILTTKICNVARRRRPCNVVTTMNPPPMIATKTKQTWNQRQRRIWNLLRPLRHWQPTTATTRDRWHWRTGDIKAMTTKTVTGDIDDPQSVTETNPQPATATTRDRRHRRTRDIKAMTTKTVTGDIDDPQPTTATNSQSATAANAQRTATAIEP